MSRCTHTHTHAATFCQRCAGLYYEGDYTKQPLTWDKNFNLTLFLHARRPIPAVNHLMAKCFWIARAKSELDYLQPVDHGNYNKLVIFQTVLNWRLGTKKSYTWSWNLTVTEFSVERIPLHLQHCVESMVCHVSVWNLYVNDSSLMLLLT